VIDKKLGPPVYANSLRTRRAIYSHDTAIRICSVPRLKHKNTFVKISSGTKLQASQNIFAGLFDKPFLQILPYPRQNPMVAAQAPTWQASEWEHRLSSSAPRVVPMIPSMIGQHIKEEPCAKTKKRELLGVFSSRYSSVPRGHQIVVPIFSRSPLGTVTSGREAIS
jgi:hypothetical protein